MVETDRPSQHIVAFAFVFEGGLGAAALLLGWLLGRWPLPGVQFSGAAWTAWAGAIAAGAVASGPMLLLLVVVERFPGGPFRELQHIVDDLVVPLFAHCRLWEMGGISLIAGIGEELLFRGLLQQGLADWLGPPRGVWLALLVSSLLFGAGHWLCTGYAVLAALIGAYLGLLLIGTGNLLVPVTAHALYDFVALVYLVKWKPCRC